jgi:phage N-6-adenine-methyltransferase
MYRGDKNMSDFCSNRFKTVNQSWETPQWLFDKLDEEFHFNIDLAADSHNTKVGLFIGKDEDALTKKWNCVGWLNPPYGDSSKNSLKVWVKKAYDESRENGGIIVMLIPARTNTKWWHDYCMTAGEVRFIEGRPKFKGCTHGLPQPLAIVVFDRTRSIKFSGMKVK